MWPVLKSLPRADIDRVLSRARRRTFKRNEPIIRQGDPAKSLHLISKGTVAVTVTTPMGDQATLRVLGHGDFFGESGLYSKDGVRGATVWALEECEVLSVTEQDFHALRDEYPEVNEVIISIMAQWLRESSHLLLECLYVPAELRVLRRLLELVDRYSNGTEPAVIPLTQDMIAGIAGTSRETVNRVLTDEKQKGNIELGRRKITVLNPEALKRRAG